MASADVSLRRVRRGLEQVERQIYELEGAFLAANADGNPITGWNDALTRETAAPAAERVKAPSPSDRLFTLSSVTSPRPVVAPFSGSSGAVTAAAAAAPNASVDNASVNNASAAALP